MKIVSTIDGLVFECYDRFQSVKSLNCDKMTGRCFSSISRFFLIFLCEYVNSSLDYSGKCLTQN